MMIFCTKHQHNTDLNSTSGALTHRYYERDYLGSVRAVFDLYGNLEQTNDYNVTGIPSSRHLGNADVPGKIIPIKIGYNIQHSIDGFLKLDLPE